MYSTATEYCQANFNKALAKHKHHSRIYAAFNALGQEIGKLEASVEAVYWYALATEWLRSTTEVPNDMLNPLDTLSIQAELLLEGSHPRLKKAAYAMSVIAITLGVLVAGVAIGLGIGCLMGLWATPIGFIGALLALEQTAILIAGVSASLSAGAFALSSYLFFKEPALKQSLANCIDSIKATALDGEEAAACDDLHCQNPFNEGYQPACH